MMTREIAHMRIGKEQRQTLALTALGWAGCFALFLAIRLSGSGVSLRFATHIFGLCLLGLVFSMMLFRLAPWIAAREGVPRRAGAVLLAACGAAFALVLVDTGLSVALATDSGRTLASQFLRSLENMIGLTFLFGMLSAVYLLVHSNARSRERDRELVEARAAANEAEARANAARFEALRYQLNPHFLFNTLNAVSSLVINRENDEAEAVLAKLSDFLRTTLMADRSGESTVGNELEMLENYLEIETLRFAGRLRFRVDCPPNLEDSRLPSFLLQPLIENAMKYAVAPVARPVSVAVIVSQEGEDLVVRVEDDGDPAGAAAIPGGTGLGLANIRQRLDVLYGARATLATEARPDGYRACVRLPREPGLANARVA
jgi:signal transduction histidine kinase